MAKVVAHIGECTLWYAIDLSARGKDLQAVEHRLKSESGNSELVDAVVAYSSVLVAVVGASPVSARGFHPWGIADPAGFAAMACDELLIHTDDIAHAVGLTFQPPTDLAEAVLKRLFPWVTVDDDPWQLLRWANGRVALSNRDRLKEWRWYCSPLEAWDGRARGGETT